MKLATSTGYMFAIVLQLSLFSLAESLRCYQCSSEDEYTCGEFFDPKFTDVSVTECPLSDAQYCIKTTGIFSGNLGAKRFCSERFLDNYCTYVRRPGDQREYRSCVYTCTGDGCNSSTGLTPTKLIPMSALLLLTATAMTSHRL
ncbi:U-scoloptoxin(05)-Sa1a-like isoform X2 [Daphnia carinata]|uniref:U-scoloptoxin(05)-Sa1a-like isoform X2 n=1 Tax=Daphnia carinata TaxID=120202 RepID=UPI00257AB224|nr:U-scoloptoxin(05)-Sa1a-like isoform X2 [Daphnia carinata]